MKSRQGFVSNSSSSSFIIGHTRIDEVATTMFDIVMEDWNCCDDGKYREMYEGWRQNLKDALTTSSVLDGTIGLMLPSTNYETYIIIKDGKIYVATANNHDWTPLNDDMVGSGGGEDDEETDAIYSLLKDCTFFNIKNRIIHSYHKYSFQDKETYVCPNPECNRYYGSYVIIDGEKVCGECYKGVLNTNKILDEIGKPESKKIRIDVTPEELNELINGLKCSYDQGRCIEEEIAKKLVEKLKCNKE